LLDILQTRVALSCQKHQPITRAVKKSQPLGRHFDNCKQKMRRDFCRKNSTHMQYQAGAKPAKYKSEKGMLSRTKTCRSLVLPLKFNDPIKFLSPNSYYHFNHFY
jgi:hypothetical protein